jgi:hypothetical protein
MTTGYKDGARRCNHPDHVGKRYLPITEFHKQGIKHGKQYYKTHCKECCNKQYRRMYAEKKRNNNWTGRKPYIRARSRALTRLSKLVPELYMKVLKEELVEEGMDPYRIELLLERMKVRKLLEQEK